MSTFLPPGSPSLERVGTALTRYGLVLVILWIGLFKFTVVEARAIQPLVEHHPLMAWLYSVLSVQGVSNVIGSVEILIAGMIAVRPWSPRVSALGSGLAIGMFLTTLSFLATTPDMWDVEGWIVIPNQFLLKDVVFLGAATWTAAEAWRSVERPDARPSLPSTSADTDTPPRRGPGTVPPPP
jgi:uncharacterized membrane protein YkgB